MKTEGSHWLDVRDKPAFLHRLMTELAGNALMSLEGDLSKCQFAEGVVVSREETGVLKRATRSPELDFCVLKLNPETIKAIFTQIIIAGLSDDIIHVQIEKTEVLELGAYDNFHSDCVVTGSGIGKMLLDELAQRKIIRNYRLAVQNS